MPNSTDQTDAKVSPARDTQTGDAAPREAYAPPRLERLGTVLELTRGGIAGGNEWPDHGSGT